MKTCFKCGRTLPLDAFYKHPKMKDGCLNKCRDCTKADVRNYRLNNPGKLKDYEEKRNHRPARIVQMREHLQRHRAAFPEKNRARQAVSREVKAGRMCKLPCQFPGCGSLNVEAHHPDYSKPLEVIWYCHRHHRAVEGRIAA